jgi:hypothetical protein
MRIIIIMLDKLGLNDEKKKVKETWEVFLKDTELLRPKVYTMHDPEKPLQLIVDEFYDF